MTQKMRVRRFSAVVVFRFNVLTFQRFNGFGCGSGTKCPQTLPLPAKALLCNSPPMKKRYHNRHPGSPSDMSDASDPSDQSDRFNLQLSTLRIPINFNVTGNLR